MTVLVVVDHHDGVPRGSAAELLTAARALGPAQAVWFGDAAPHLGEYGAAVVHVVPDADLPPARAAVLAGLVEQTGAATVLLTSTFENKEVAARLALATDAGLVVDATGVERDADGRIVTTQQAFAASWTLRAVITAPRAVVTVKANAVPAIPESSTPEMRVHEVEVPVDPRVRVVERVPRPGSGRPDLAEAQVVVVGGRGTDGDFSAVEDLADALGAAIGATRVATDEGWIGHEAQIGQTGVTVSPRLYIGAGVSGAVHHRGGMQASGTIVAINTDPESPIFEIADYGIVGDLFTVVPALTEELKKLR